MNDIANMTAPPATIQIGGQNYTLGPLTFADFGRIVQLVRDAIVNSAAASLHNMQREADKRIVMQEAYNAAKQVKFVVTNPETGEQQTSPEVTDFLQSPDGAVRLVHFSLAKHQDVSVDDVGRMLSDIDALESIVDRIMQISGLGGDTDKGGGATGPKPKSVPGDEASPAS